MRRRLPLPGLLLLALAFALGACASKPEPPGDWERVRAEDLEALVTVDPALAFEEASFLLASADADDEDGEKWRLLALEAAGQIAARLGNATLDPDADPVDGLAALLSARVLASDPIAASLFEGAALGAETESQFLLSRADAFWGEGKEAAAFTLFLEAFELGVMDSGELAVWTARAMEGRNRAVLRSVLASAPSSLDAAATEYASGSDPIHELLKGTVTIWVNKGIKVERGVGSPERVIGSGFFIDRSGYILTNYHVIASEVDPEYEGYSRLSVRLPGSSELRVPARVVGWDPVFDLALLKAELAPEFWLSFSGRAAFAPGDRIFAIGSPVGLESTVTSGIVSAAGRRFLELGDAVQVDVAVNPGNSGGPLLDGRGELAGIVFAGMPQFQGLNFAVPSRWIVALLPGLYDGGETVHAWTGLAFHENPAPPELLYGFPGSPGTPLPGDRLVAVDGVRVGALVDAQARLLGRVPGTLVRLGFESARGAYATPIALRSRPDHPVDEALTFDVRENLYPVLFGMRLDPRPGGIFGKSGFTVGKIWFGGAADESGLSESDPLLVQGFESFDDERYAVLRLYVKRRKAGFLDSIIAIPASLDVPSFL
ncbi:MAG: trypsin-like peptidase domain-containing protein [Spirochaetales bacterium]|nr:trypsin-like peptidase domain-containing protein [Spirochaetales bacterium]